MLLNQGFYVTTHFYIVPPELEVSPLFLHTEQEAEQCTPVIGAHNLDPLCIKWEQPPRSATSQVLYPTSTQH